MLIPYTVSIFIYIIILMAGTTVTLFFSIENHPSQNKAVLCFQKFLYSFLAYVATGFLYTIMAFGNNQSGIFEAVMLLSDVAYFSFIIYWIQTLRALTGLPKRSYIFTVVTIVYAAGLEAMIILSDYFPEPFLALFAAPIKLANFFYLLFLTATGLFYFITALWMPKKKERKISLFWSALFILYPVFELPWMVFVGLIKKTDSNITVRFDLILFSYFGFCIYWLYERLYRSNRLLVKKEPFKAPSLAVSFSDSWGLTPREAQICELVAKGLTNPEIAQRLCISENTVKHHLNSCFKKLEVKNRYELIVRISGLSSEK